MNINIDFINEIRHFSIKQLLNALRTLGGPIPQLTYLENCRRNKFRESKCDFMIISINDYSYKSVANQIPHNAGLSLIHRAGDQTLNH